MHTVKLLSFTLILLLFCKVVYPTNTDYEYDNANSSQSAEYTNKLVWTWKCIDGKCVPKKVLNTLIYNRRQSLRTCNMLCSAIHIWPQPTRQAIYSPDIIPIKIQSVTLLLEDLDDILVKEYENLLEDFRSSIKLLANEELLSHPYNLRGFHISINSTIEYNILMKYNTNEDYDLHIYTEGTDLKGNIYANSYVGVVHALESLKQIIWLDETYNALVTYLEVNISDGPQFKYRGLMIDTTQNFLSVDEVTDVVKAMSALKFNTLHWHIDAVQIMAWIDKMLVVKSSAYVRPFMYTYENVVYIVKFARDRGVRIILEVNTPSHVGDMYNWDPAYGFGEIAHCTDPESFPTYCDELPCGQLNPRNEYVYDVLEKIYKTIIELTGVNDTFHMSGYGISETCWKKHFNNSDPKELWLHFISNALKRLEKVNQNIPQQIIFWSSKFTEDVKSKLAMKRFRPSISLQIYNQKYIAQLPKILSHKDMWDFNSMSGTWFHSLEKTNYNTWQKIYEYRPWKRNATKDILGGEATIWSRNIWPGNLLGQVWHRLAALSERLWRDPDEVVSPQLITRLDILTGTYNSILTDRLVPLWSEWCSQNPFTCS